MNIPNFLTFEISGQLNDRKEIIIGVDIFAGKKNETVNKAFKGLRFFLNSVVESLPHFH